MVSRSQPLQLDESAGAVAILRTAVGLLPRIPAVVGIYVLIAVLSLLSIQLGNFASPVGQSVAVLLAYRELGGEADANNSLGVRLLLALLAALVAGFGIIIGLVFFVLPGLFLMVRLRLVVAAVMLEDGGPLEALGRSFDLTSGHGWTVFGVWFVPFVASLPVLVVVVVATGGVSLSGNVDPAALQSGMRLAGAASVLITGPIVAAADAVMFGLYGPDALGNGRETEATSERASGVADGYEY